jgi:BASS family bile acid:Na+ symporter
VSLQQLVTLALQVSIVLTVLGFGLKTRLDDLLGLVRRPNWLVRSFLAVFIVMPLVAILLIRLFEFGQVVTIALIALAISPAPPLLPQRQERAHRPDQEPAATCGRYARAGPSAQSGGKE